MTEAAGVFDVFPLTAARMTPPWSCSRAAFKAPPSKRRRPPMVRSLAACPGRPWQESIEQALDASRTCAIVIGRSGIGP